MCHNLLTSVIENKVPSLSEARHKPKVSMQPHHEAQASARLRAQDMSPSVQGRTRVLDTMTRVASGLTSPTLLRAGGLEIAYLAIPTPEDTCQRERRSSNQESAFPTAKTDLDDWCMFNRVDLVCC